MPELHPDNCKCEVCAGVPTGATMGFKCGNCTVVVVVTAGGKEKAQKLAQEHADECERLQQMLRMIRKTKRGTIKGTSCPLCGTIFETSEKGKEALEEVMVALGFHQTKCAKAYLGT
jgi:hypothetical protein